MTDPRYLPIALTTTGELTADHGDDGTGDLVGADDAAADTARTDADLTGAQRDTDPTPVGVAESDRRRVAGEG
ncbi:hypothetical protein [Micromonospora sp. LOL_024]|uniref:hypothetical protein n=1 Tax=Micromonospora sp. LOL_024 TaxID=3345412 RepID=UPI003A8C1B73